MEGSITVKVAPMVFFRNIEDFVTWVDSSKIKQHVLNYNDEVSCGVAFFNLLSKSEIFIMIVVVWPNHLFSLSCDSFRGMTLTLWNKSVIH